MLTVGRMVWVSDKTGQKLQNPNSLTYSMMLLASHFDVELFLFSSAGVNTENRTVEGLFVEDGKQFYKTVPFPPITDNGVVGLNRTIREMGKTSVLVNPLPKPGKLKDYEDILGGPFAHMLIPTTTAKTFDDITAVISEHGSAIVKSTKGSGGHSIHKIFRDENADGFKVHKDHEITEMTREQADEYFNGLFSERVYIAQPFLRSVTNFDEPCDVRVHCRRGSGGKWFTDLIPRIGSKAGIVSNVHSGGYCMNPIPFFKREFGDNYKAVNDALMAFGRGFCEYYQSLYPKYVTSSVGVDVGITRTATGGGFKLWIFEVNNYLGDYPIPRVTDIIHQLHYYKYLAGVTGVTDLKGITE